MEEVHEDVPELEENNYLEAIRVSMEVNKLYERNTSISDRDLDSEENGRIKRKYLNTLIKEAEIGIQEEYFDLIVDEIEMDKKLKVKNK